MEVPLPTLRWNKAGGWGITFCFFSLCSLQAYPLFRLASLRCSLVSLKTRPLRCEIGVCSDRPAGAETVLHDRAIGTAPKAFSSAGVGFESVGARVHSVDGNGTGSAGERASPNVTTNACWILSLCFSRSGKEYCNAKDKSSEPKGGDHMNSRPTR